MVALDYIVRYAQCCRLWPIAVPGSISKCSLCKQVPQVISSFTDDDYKNWKESK